jgi:uncharacterized protein (DUF169 family)
MDDVQALSQTFRRLLQLKTAPVAVRVIKNQEEIPVLFKKPDFPIPSFCYGVMAGFKGKNFYLERTDVQCATGLQALGFKKEGGQGGSKKKPGPKGIFGNEEAARNYFSKGSTLKEGQTKGVLICPLEKAVTGVDVALFKVSSEQTMWLLAATQYLSGGRNDLCLGTGYQGVCGDVIAYPLVTQKVNITVNGISDHVSNGKSKNEIFVGIPGPLLGKIASNLNELLNKPVLKTIHSPRCVQKYGFFGTTTVSGKRPRITSG